jgi:hypothetical protein
LLLPFDEEGECVSVDEGFDHVFKHPEYDIIRNILLHEQKV